MGLLGSFAWARLSARGVPGSFDRAPKARNQLNWIELGVGKKRGSGGARAEMSADWLGKCHLRGTSEIESGSAAREPP
jgi:hypothetical protein